MAASFAAVLPLLDLRAVNDIGADRFDLLRAVGGMETDHAFVGQHTAVDDLAPSLPAAQQSTVAQVGDDAGPLGRPAMAVKAAMGEILRPLRDRCRIG